MHAMNLRTLELTLTSALLLPGLALAEAPAAADTAKEEVFLDVLPKLEVPEDVQPIPGALNEEFRNCEARWPAGYRGAQSGPEARALRDIYSLVRARNVIATKDCGCTGKVASWDDVETVATALREQGDVERLTWKDTQVIATEARKLISIAETMCGGAF